MKKEYEDVLESRKRYVGQEKKTFLYTVANDANTAHELAAGAWRDALEHAREAGDALRVAKKVNGGRGRWTRWLTANFRGSRETARLYMRVSRNWDDQRLILARAKGMEPTSIQSFFHILKGKGTVKQISRGSGEHPVRASIKDLFVKKLKALNEDELDILYGSFDSVWKKLYEDLQDRVCIVTESDYYCTDPEWSMFQKRQIRVLRRKEFQEKARVLEDSKKIMEDKRPNLPR